MESEPIWEDFAALPAEAQKQVADYVAFLRQRYLKQQPSEIRVEAEQRASLDDEYRERKYLAHNIDIIGIAMSRALQELATEDRLLEHILCGRAHMRIMFLSPVAGYVERRAHEDGKTVRELSEILEQSLLYCARPRNNSVEGQSNPEIYRRLSDLYKTAMNMKQLTLPNAGSLEIRLIDSCPHYTIYRTDEDILWGLYTSDTTGLYRAVISVPQKQNILFGQLMGHFDTLWNECAERWIIRYRGLDQPQLNSDLLIEILKGIEARSRY